MAIGNGISQLGNRNGNLKKIQITFSFLLVSTMSSESKFRELHIMLKKYSIDQVYISVLNLLDIHYTPYHSKIQRETSLQVLL